jgi:predicted phage terminase large subunit-like protein
VVRQCLSSPLWAGFYLCGYDKFDSDFHRALDEWHLMKLDEGAKRFLIMVARDHLKTSYFGVSHSIFRMIRDPEERILYVMASASESTKTLRAVQRIMESDTLRHFFPDRALNRSTMRATENFMDLKRTGVYREHTMEARGATSTLTGGHFTTQVFDDLIDSTIERSDVEQERVIAFFRDATNMFVNMEEDERYVVGTRWGGMFYDWLLDESGIADRYEKLVIGCEVDARYRRFLAEIGKKTTLKDGDPIWHEQFSKKTFAEVEIEEGPIIFNRQFRNLATLDDDRRFSSDDFNVYFQTLEENPLERTCVVQTGMGNAIRVPVKRLQRTLVCDPGTGEHKKTDDSAVSVCGYDKETGYIFVLNEWALKVKPDALIDQICHTISQWQPHISGIEEGTFQTVLKNSLIRALAARGLSTSVRPVKPGHRNKLTRIEGLQPYTAAGQMCVLKDQKRLVDELCRLQIVRGKLVGRSPNRADALAYHADFWRHASTPETIINEDDAGEWDSSQEFRPRSYGLECTT